MKNAVRFCCLFFVVLFSGCTVAHFVYVRNCRDHAVKVTMEFRPEASSSLPQQVYVPYSDLLHLVNDRTLVYMTDSLCFRKNGTTKMEAYLPSGAMIMIDKPTSAKVHYHEPVSFIVADTVKKQTDKIVFGNASGDDKLFSSRKTIGKIYWYDVR